VSGSSLDIRPLKMGLPRSPEKLVTIHPVMRRTLPEYQTLHEWLILLPASRSKNKLLNEYLNKWSLSLGSGLHFTCSLHTAEVLRVFHTKFPFRWNGSLWTCPSHICIHDIRYENACWNNNHAHACCSCHCLLFSPLRSISRTFNFPQGLSTAWERSACKTTVWTPPALSRASFIELFSFHQYQGKLRSVSLWNFLHSHFINSVQSRSSSSLVRNFVSYVKKD
jgi:hypothetical protein